MRVMLCLARTGFGDAYYVAIMTTAPLAGASATLRDAMAVIDHGGQGICCLVDDDGRLAGVLTDGDVRRALLTGHDLAESAVDFATATPQTVAAGTPRAHVLDLMNAWRILAIPEVDQDRRLVQVHTLAEIIGPSVLPNSAVIMAGGKGTRLGDLTAHTPKPMMTVAGRSVIEWLILGLVGDGIRHVYISVNHLADKLVDHLGDGSRFGCEIEYLWEDPEVPLGTGGSLGLIKRTPTEPLIVMNGDLMVEFDTRQLLAFHQAQRSTVTLGVREYRHTIPFGVIETEADDQVRQMVEKPDLAFTVNAGIYCVEPKALDVIIPGQPTDMPELVQRCLDRGDVVAAWEWSSDWIDIGTPADLARAKGHA